MDDCWLQAGGQHVISISSSLDKREISQILFSYFSIETYVVGTQKKDGSFEHQNIHFE